MPKRNSSRVKRDELVGLLRQEIIQADGWANSPLAELRTQALGYYFGELPGPEAAGRSVAVSTDVADMVEAVVAQILPGFSGDNVVEFEPNDEEDIEQAQMESDIVNDVVLEQNRGYVFFQEALRDALLLRNGWTKCYAEEYDTVRQQLLPEGVAEDDLALLMAELESEPGIRSVVVEAGQEGAGSVLKITRTQRRMCVSAADPTNIVFESDWDSVFLDGIRFMAERSYPTRSDLIEEGYSRAAVDRCSAYGMQPIGSDYTARYQRPGGSSNAPQQQIASLPWAVQPVEVYRCFYMYDSDGDGIAELHEIMLGGGTEILRDQIVDFIPYATGTPFLQAHQLNGLGLFDKIRTVQDIKTATLRKWINNLEACNNARVGVNERTVNLDDAVNSRPGGIVRFKGSPSTDMAAFPIVDTGASSLALLGYADKMRSERGGASLDMQSAEAQVGSNASGVAVDREYSAKEQLAAMACRTLAETLVRSTYAIVHRGLRTWFAEEVSARVRGEFVKSNPKEWAQRDRINVKSGLSVGERSQKKVALEQVLGQQEKIIAAGLTGQLADTSGVYRAQLDWTRAAGLDNGERYFIDPESQEGQQAAQASAQAAQAANAESMEIQKQIATAQQQVEAMKSAIDKYQADTETSFKYFNAVLQAQVEAMKLGQQNAVNQLSAEGLDESEEAKDEERVSDGSGDAPSAVGVVG